jgi:hypothetical protein
MSGWNCSCKPSRFDLETNILLGDGGLSASFSRILQVFKSCIFALLEMSLFSKTIPGDKTRGFLKNQSQNSNGVQPPTRLLFWQKRDLALFNTKNGNESNLLHNVEIL